MRPCPGTDRAGRRRRRIVDAAGERFVFLESQWSALGERAVGALRIFHAQQPDEPGIDRGRLRRMTLPTLADAAWRAVIDDLVQRQAVQRSGHWLHLPDHRITWDERELELAQKLRSAIAAGRFDPPWVRDLAHTVRAPDDEVRAVLRKCVVQGGLYQIVRDLYYHRDCVRELARIVKGLVDEHGVMEAARFRDAIGVGRKRTIQIWSSSTALAILAVRAMRGYCVSTAAGKTRTRSLSD